METQNILAHGWWTNEGQKISKSLGNVIDPYDLIERYGLDPVRYFLLREIPFGNDGNFSKEAIKKRVNSDLANDYGNLCQRVLAMIVKNCDGRLSDCTPQTQDDSDFIAPLEQLPQEVDALMQKQAFHKVLELIWQHISNANRYIDAQAPWKLKKTDPVRMHAILSILVDAIRRVTFVTQPFMPNITAQIFQQLNTDSGNTSLSAGHKINQPVPLFQKIEGD
ncbi:MAG: class I tRNA ligase family protein [Cyanobacteria bacterium J06558_2]